MIAPSKLLTATGNFLKRNLGYSNEFLNARAYGKSAGLLPASVSVPTVNDFGAKSITSGCRGLQVKLKASYNRDAFLVAEGPVSIWADIKPAQIQNSNLNSKNKKFLKILQGATNIMVSNFLKNSFI